MAIEKRLSKCGKKSSYVVRVFQGYDHEGKRLEITKTKANKKDAVLLEAEIKLKLAEGTWQEPTRLKLAEYLDQWLEKSVKVSRKPQTYQLYANVVRIYIVPALGHLSLSKVHPLAVQELLNELSEERTVKKKGKRGVSREVLQRLAPSTVKNVHTVMSSAFNQAVKWRYINHSPAAHVDLPQREASAEGNTVRAMDPEQALAFMEAAKAEALGIVLVFALLTGARPGEYLALLWSDLDWKAREVKIERTIFRPLGGGWQFGTPKTKSSYRTVPLPPELLDLLKVHRTQQLKQRLALGATWQDDADFIFRNELGGPLDSKRLAKRTFSRVLKAAGLTGRFSLYNLRHSCATLLLLAEEPAKVVSQRLGHSSISVTLDIYTEVLPTLQHRATEKLRYLFSPPPAAVVS